MKTRVIFAALLGLFIGQTCAGQDYAILRWLGAIPPADPFAPDRWTMTRGMMLPAKSTDSTIKKVEVESPQSHREVTLPEPVTSVTPADSGSLSSGTGGAASVIISPLYTFFALASSGNILQLDLSTAAAQTVRSLATTQTMVAGVASPGNAFLYAASTGTAAGFQPSVQIVDLTTFQLTGSIPLPATAIPAVMALTRDGKYLFVAGQLRAQTFTDPDGVDCYLIDTTTRAVVTTFHFPGSSSRPEMLMSPDGGRVFLAVPGGVAVIDVLTQSVSHTIPENFFGSPHIAADPSGTFLFAGPTLSNQVTGIDMFDLTSSARVQSIPIPNLSTMAMAVTEDGAFLVVNHIVPDPITGLNDFPSAEFISLPDGNLVLTKPWSGSRTEPITVGGAIPTAIPAP